MPRLPYPKKPVNILTIKLDKKKFYYLVSDNGYTYHHSDNFWRVRCLKKHTTYLYSRKMDAIRKAKFFNDTLRY